MGPEFRAEIINMLQMKIYICCEKLSNLVQIQKSAFKIQIARTPDLISRGEHTLRSRIAEGGSNKRGGPKFL